MGTLVSVTPLASVLCSPITIRRAPQRGPRMWRPATPAFTRGERYPSSPPGDGGPSALPLIRGPRHIDHYARSKLSARTSPAASSYLAIRPTIKCRWQQDAHRRQARTVGGGGRVSVSWATPRMPSSASATSSHRRYHLPRPVPALLAADLNFWRRHAGPHRRAGYGGAPASPCSTAVAQQSSPPSSGRRLLRLSRRCPPHENSAAVVRCHRCLCHRR